MVRKTPSTAKLREALLVSPLPREGGLFASLLQMPIHPINSMVLGPFLPTKSGISEPPSRGRGTTKWWKEFLSLHQQIKPLNSNLSNCLQHKNHPNCGELPHFRVGFACVDRIILLCCFCLLLCADGASFTALFLNPLSKKFHRQGTL